MPHGERHGLVRASATGDGGVVPDRCLSDEASSRACRTRVSTSEARVNPLLSAASSQFSGACNHEIVRYLLLSISSRALRAEETGLSPAACPIDDRHVRNRFVRRKWPRQALTSLQRRCKPGNQLWILRMAGYPLVAAARPLLTQSSQLLPYGCSGLVGVEPPRLGVMGSGWVAIENAPLQFIRSALRQNASLFRSRTQAWRIVCSISRMSR